MTRTKTEQRVNRNLLGLSVDSYSGSPDSGNSFSVSHSSEEEPIPKRSSRNRKNAEKSRPEQEQKTPQSQRSENSIKEKLNEDKKNRWPGFETSSNDSTSGDNFDASSLNESDRPDQKGDKRKEPRLEFGDPRRQKNYKNKYEHTDDKSDTSDDDDTEKPSDRQVLRFGANSPSDASTDVENQYSSSDTSDDSDDSDESSSFAPGFNHRKLNTPTGEAEDYEARNGVQAPKNTKSANMSDNDMKVFKSGATFNEDTEDINDGDKQIPERKRFLTRERKIITCLTVFVGCFSILAALGIGIAIGLSTKSSDVVLPIPMAPPQDSLYNTPSQTPSIQASLPLDTMLLQLLIENSFDSGEALLTQGTPQRMAYEWLSRNAGLPSYTTEQKLARYALATFYHSTNGPSTWAENIRNGGWMTDAPECEWASTARNQCSGIIYSSLTLDFVGVSGQLPLELAYLTGLERLSLRSEGIGTPSIAGSLPDTIGRLENLQTIRLNENNIGGALPSEIGALTNMRVFLMSGNSLQGSIPSEIGRTMGNTYNFDRNQLVGRLPIELFRMGTLTAVNFEDNSIAGNIPRDIGMNPSLNSVNLASNKLTGTIPTEFGRLVTMRSGINLANNELSGSLPSELGFLVDMQNLQLNNNRLVGNVPAQYSEITDMRLLRVDGNLLAGELPQNICNSFTTRSVSYSDCGTPSFACSCCTFCCNGQICTCNSDDESICTKTVLDQASTESAEPDQRGSGLYYSENDENRGTFVRDSSRRILASIHREI